MDLKKFDDIRTFNEEEYRNYINKYVDSFYFETIYSWVFNSNSKQDRQRYFTQELKNLNDFKLNFIVKTAIKKIATDKTAEVTAGGLENLENDGTYMFISNHRDISLDAAFLNYILVSNNKISTKTAIGDNLLVNEFIEGIAKSIGCFIVKRNLPPRESIIASKILSEYIEYVLFTERESMWIAQKAGRTKDGNDVTNPAVIKMICMGNNNLSLEDFLKKLRIVPISISYEFDPTDYMKIPELIANENNQKYSKKENEDALSTIKGVLGYKGRVHFEFSKPLDKEIDILKDYDSEKQKIKILSEIIDKCIHTNFKLREINYLAYDKLNNTNRFKEKYTQKDIDFFNHRIEIRSKELGIDLNTLEKHFLKIYGTPVENKYKY